MTRLEAYAWCIGLSFLGLCWLAFGIGGVACLIVGLIVGNVDLSWIEAEETVEREPASAPVVPLVLLPAPDVQLADVDVTPRKWHTTVPAGTLVKRPSLFKQVQSRSKRKVKSNVISFPRTTRTG